VADLFNDMNRLRGLFSLFEQKTELLQLLEAGRKGQGIHIFVGSESGLASLEECSVITAPYSADGRVVGTLAVVGPKRMDYQRVVPIVDITGAAAGQCALLQLSSGITHISAPPNDLPTEPPYAHGTPAKTGILLVNSALLTRPPPCGAPLPEGIPRRPARRRDTEAIWWLILTASSSTPGRKNPPPNMPRCG